MAREVQSIRIVALFQVIDLLKKLLPLHSQLAFLLEALDDEPPDIGSYLVVKVKGFIVNGRDEIGN